MSWPSVRANGPFSVNVLSQGQSAVSKALARSGPEKWDAIDWRETPAGNPAIDQCPVWLDCELFEVHEAGDHTLVVASVIDMQAPEAVPALSPLLFFKGQYGSIAG